MGKGRRPRKPKDSASEEFERQTEPKGELVPPPRRPPTAVGAETPETPPPPPPPSPPPVRVRSRHTPSRPVLAELFQTLRTAALALLDIADAAAEAITKQLERRA